MAPGRTVVLVVVDADGELRGQLDPFDVATPWWQDLDPIVARHPELVVLRLLDVEAAAADGSMGGTVRYEVQSTAPVSGLRSIPDRGGDSLAAALADDPQRMPWARPGGPQADLAWAAQHVAMTGRPRQARSWNLSSIWRLPTANGEHWLKCVPPFFAHEAAVLRALGPSPALPHLVAADGTGRMLLEAMPGEDGYGAAEDEVRHIIDTLVDLQLAAIDRTPELRGSVPDWTAEPLLAAAVPVVAHGAPDLAPARLRDLLDGWDVRFAAIAACGLPDVVFHGDLHPGNARLGTDPPVIFDWGDAGIGHPLLDLAVVQDDATSDAAKVRRHWLERWEAAVPGSEAARAWQLLRPIAVLRGAVVFQRFLDAIEPSERVYHRNDVARHLRLADALLATPPK